MIYKNNGYTTLYPNWTDEREKLYQSVYTALNKNNYKYDCEKGDSIIKWYNIPFEEAIKYTNELRKNKIIAYLITSDKDNLIFEMKRMTIPTQL